MSDTFNKVMAGEPIPDIGGKVPTMTTALSLVPVDDAEPIPLADACRLFPHAKLTVSTLRAEAARGNLDIFRLGKRDYTTLTSMRSMVQLCQERNRRPGSISTKAVNSGLSETARRSSALAAAKASVVRLKAS